MRLSRWILALCLSLGLAAHAGDAAKAHAFFKKGEAALTAKRGPEAVAAFKASYAESAAPSLLFYLGEAYRLAGDTANAVASYEGYLAKVPNAPRKAEAETHLAALKAGAAAAAAPKRKIEVGDIDLELEPAEVAKKPAGAKAKGKHKATALKEGDHPPAPAAAAQPAPGPVDAGAGGDLSLDLFGPEKTTPPPAAAPAPAKPPDLVKPIEPTKPPAPPPTVAAAPKPTPAPPAPAARKPAPFVQASEDSGPRRGFKLAASISAGLGILAHPTFFSSASNTTTDQETAPEVGLEVEAGWRFGAFSLGLQVQAFTAGTPEIFNKDLVVAFTAGPRLEYAIGIVRLGLSGSYAIAPKTFWLGFDGGVGADVGLQFGQFGVRVTSGALFGTGAYQTQAGGSIKTSHTTLVPVRVGLVWEY